MMPAFALARRTPEWWMAPAAILIAGVLIVLPLTSAVAMVGGALALLAILRWHELALYALILAVPFGSWFPISIGAGNVTAVDLLVVLLIALWLARMMAHDRAVRIDFPPLLFPFVLFIGAAFLSTTVTLSLQHSVIETTKWLEMCAMYLYVANTLNGAKITRALCVMFLAGTAQAAIGVYQFLFRVGPEGFSLFGRFMRAYGTFEQPNPFAGYLGLIIPVALGTALTVVVFRGRRTTARRRPSHSGLSLPADPTPCPFPTRKARNWPEDSPFSFGERGRGVRFDGDGGGLSLRSGAVLARHIWGFAAAGLAAGALVAMLAALLMSWSRGAWLGVGAAIVVTIIVQSRRAFLISLIAAFVLTFVILLSSINVIPEVIAERFSGIGDYFGVFDVRGVRVDDANYAIVERMAHWQAAVEMFVEHPVLGGGIGNYEVIYPAYALPRWSDPLGHAHNYYLNVAAETGLVGLVAYLILWSAALWQAWRAVRVLHGAARGIAAGLLGMIVALSVHNAFDNLFVHGMAVQVGIGLGLIAALRRQNGAGDPQRMTE